METLLHENGTLRDIVHEIRRIAKESASADHIKSVARKLKGKGLKAVFDYVFKQVAYTPDPPDVQQIRYATRTLKDRRGNCVDYSVLLSSILQNMKVPHKLRVTDYGRGFAHIYVKAGNVALDPVLGQRQDGTEHLSGRRGFFNRELKFKRKLDYPMTRITALQGTSGCNCQGQRLGRAPGRRRRRHIPIAFCKCNDGSTRRCRRCPTGGTLIYWG